ncbi:hypothetical protein DRN63_04065 [Nanoarchaeota archaeon]|nr:MAG: hypothetical protein DRN63_04065 [Nanoarchaeota archaeon]
MPVRKKVREMLKPLMKVLRLTSLFLSAFGVRCLVWLTDVRRYLGLIEYDGVAYISWGREMVSRICRGDWSGFLVNPVHPPLGKLMIGAFTYLMDPMLDPYRSATLLMCIISSITSIIVYGIGSSMLDKKRGLIAWMAYTFDPFSIHWTMAWLDASAILFMTLSLYMLLRYRIDGRTHFIILSMIFYGLALMIKFQAILFIFMFFSVIEKWKMRAFFAMMAIMVNVLNPQFWTPSGIYEVFKTNIWITSLSFQEVDASKIPLLIVIEIFYRLGVGYVGAGVLPYVLPLIAFFSMILKGVYFRSIKFDPFLRVLFWSLIGILMTPRMIFPEYYYAYTVPPLSLLISHLLADKIILGGSLPKNLIVRLFEASSILSIVSWIINPSCWKILLLLAIV